MNRKISFLLFPLSAALAGIACSIGALSGISAQTSLASPPGQSSPSQPVIAGTISGVVRSKVGPVQGAVIRALSTNRSAISAADGKFTLTDLDPLRPVNLSAWAQGYFVAGRNAVLPGETDVILEMVPHPTEDNPDYQWVSAFRNPDQPLACQHCMSCGSCDAARSTFPFDEWRRDAHSQSAINPRFLSMYNGTDLRGHKSPLTRYAFHRDYGRLPLRPDPTQPYYGPGFKLDFPESAGNCAACHLPAAAVNAAYQIDPNIVSGVGREGVACDFCHKVRAVRLDKSTGMPYPNMPGVLSFEFMRPREGKQIFIGPYDDVPGDSVFSPLQNRSEYCAPCHFGVFWNVTIYNSFGEWLASPYADPKTGKTCQDCHMPHVGATRIAQLPAGSPRSAYDRDPRTIFSHAMPGAADVTLLQNSVTMTTTAQRNGNRLVIEVSIVNDKTGHRVPTDSPLRSVLLIVNARDEQGHALTQRDGSTLPAWAGDYAGRPGKGFAKVLEELWTEVSPSGAYWNLTRILSDNRIAAFATDLSRYTFDTPTGEVVVEVKLIYRRAFQELMKQKGWIAPDIVMESFMTTVR